LARILNFLTLACHLSKAEELLLSKDQALATRSLNSGLANYHFSNLKPPFLGLWDSPDSQIIGVWSLPILARALAEDKGKAASKLVVQKILSSLHITWFS
jgi:hypothetical protein